MTFENRPKTKTFMNSPIQHINEPKGCGMISYNFYIHFNFQQNQFN